jgi:hypothetical protein
MRIKDRITRWLDDTGTKESPLSLRNLNFFIENNVLYSYGHHWPLAYRYQTARGYNAKGQLEQGWSILLNECGYSGQTRMTLDHIQNALEQTKIKYKQIPVGGRNHVGRAYQSRNAEIMKSLIPNNEVVLEQDCPDSNINYAFKLKFFGPDPDNSLTSKATKLATLACKWQYAYLQKTVLARMTPHQRRKGAQHIVQVILDAWKDQQQHLILPETLIPSVQRLLRNLQQIQNSKYCLWVYEAWKDLHLGVEGYTTKSNQTNMNNHNILTAAMNLYGLTEKRLQQQHTLELLRQSA